MGTYLALCIDTEIDRGEALLLDKKPFTCPASELPYREVPSGLREVTEYILQVVSNASGISSSF